MSGIKYTLSRLRIMKRKIKNQNIQARGRGIREKRGA